MEEVVEEAGVEVLEEAVVEEAVAPESAAEVVEEAVVEESSAEPPLKKKLDGTALEE